MWYEVLMCITIFIKVFYILFRKDIDDPDDKT
jgi:hypothetical protein